MITPTKRHLNVLKELINIGTGRSASVLNTMLQSHIVLQVPCVQLIPYNDLKYELKTLGGKWLAAVNMGFEGKFTGSTQLIFPTESASKLVAALVGEAPLPMDVDEIREGTLCEVGNIVLNGVMGSIANMLKLNFQYSVPNFMADSVDKLFAQNDAKSETVVLFARTNFKVEKLSIDGFVVMFFEVASLDELLKAIDNLIKP